MTKLRTTTVSETAKLNTPALGKSLEILSRFGGFELLENTIEGIQNLNPERKARRDLFLSEKSRTIERGNLKQLIRLWYQLITDTSDVTEMISYCEEKSTLAEISLEKNLQLAVSGSRDLERSYRNVAHFFNNTNQDKVKNVTFLNAGLEQVKDLDNPQFIDTVSNELVKHYDRLDLKENYSLLIVSGYLGANKVVERWAQIANNNKVMLITDYAHLDAPDDVMELFDESNLTGGEKYKSSVIMTCNWIMGRSRHMNIEEEDDLYVPPSGALAGRIYHTLMSQVSAGKKFGALVGVDCVRFELKKSEVAVLDRLGLVPLVKEYGKVMAFSAKTLFNGDNLGLQTYSVVRVFDFVAKVLMDFLNRRAFENFNANTRKELMGQIVRFLDGISGPDKLIEDFNIQRFEQDPRQKDRVYLDIFLKPYFPAKNFLIKMDGQKGDNGNEWETHYEQENKK
ncbi:type VI secretion system contractile sheath protein TssC [Chitinophaga silvatica]|uniref:Type VI secretion system contractile sheath protein TssC n=1 Tax=Chitinophaga silvatica TaxID=2282649 RepID=A0A3E1YEN3_9BACT|nr:DUF5458 family protein [Chitinophaga silvatica]RFS25022.1 type VI secretion system contractile sheath protein TssC [Chitinophaga silvatica]